MQTILDEQENGVILVETDDTDEYHLEFRNRKIDLLFDNILTNVKED